MEGRRLLSADPIRMGSVYIEEDVGNDAHGDTFEITFVGGAPGTQLTQVVLNGDQTQPGFSTDDMMFDSANGGRGADNGFPFSIVSLQTKDPNATVVASVEDGTTLLTLNFTNFQAGDKLVFSIDIDEVEDFDPNETDLKRINEGFDPIASGVEFQTTKLVGFFRAPHYHNATATTEFRNLYDHLLVGTGLNLSADNASGKRDRTDGAVMSLTQTPLPVSISGTVFLDQNLNLVQSGGEQGLANVQLSLWQNTGNGYVATGHTTQTDANGHYEFSKSLNLLPGTYQVREAQPAGLVSVGAIPGTVDGTTSGTTVPGDRDVLTTIDIPLGDQDSINNNFAEAEPPRLSGYVYHDRSNDGIRNPGEEGLASIDLQIVPLNTLVAQNTVTVKTNSLGFYEAVGLSPGTYRVVEVAQPQGYLDGLDRPGTVAGAAVGSVTNPGDSLENIVLQGGSAGIEYNFGELVPASLSGHVHLTDKDGNCEGVGVVPRPVADVVIRLFDNNGQQLAETKTNAAGEYQFTGLRPGTYRIVELTPAALLDGEEHVGTINGSPRGQIAGDDVVGNIVLASSEQGVKYDFCEHESSTLSGFVFHDQNESGARDAGESPIADAEIQLFAAQGTLLGTTKTNSAGYYEFRQLAAGTYRIAEKQPTGWLDGKDAAGTIDGTKVGVAGNDELANVTIGWGQTGVEYDFGELLPGSISGRVHADKDGDCVLDSDESTIAGVTIQLLNSSGDVIATTQTNANGQYAFNNLVPGMYGIRELQPNGFFHGDQNAGSHGGNDSLDDLITNVRVGSAQTLVDYNFCEIPPSSLAGRVFVDPNRDRQFNSGDTTLSQVTIQLLNEQGNVVATTQTDAEGKYKFSNLAPGTYAVRETQPAAYFQGGQKAGSGGGNDLTVDRITQILIPGGKDLVNYDFCELPAAKISGFVFQDGPAIPTTNGQLPSNLGELRDGVKSADDSPIGGVLLQLRNGLTGEAIIGEEALPGAYPSGPIQVRTDASGYYEFLHIPGGRNYAVFQIQPDGYFDGIDTVGSTTGFAFNPQVAQQTVIEPLAGQPAGDAIIRIAVVPGQLSQNNNFSEVVVSTIPPTIIPPPTPPIFPPNLPPTYIPPSPASPTLPSPNLPAMNFIAWSSPRTPAYYDSAAGTIGYTWHLSVINGGMPRDLASAESGNGSIWRSATFLETTLWRNENMNNGRWVIGVNSSGNATPATESIVFGIRGATPFSGDFDGDGSSEMGLFYKGEWFIDLNGNGQWDEADLWAKLGDDLDRPVVGDWDGDGKDDIGIYGPEWYGDQRQIDREPGLPDSHNSPSQLTQVNPDPKNIPPSQAEATDGQRLMRLNMNGPRRSDVIDHVFRYGAERDAPVSGDWNGDGIRTVGTFQAGLWRVDSNGDGLTDARDHAWHFGRAGDIPLVGDWDGNGVEDIGVYRAGQWILDVNNNHELDVHDRVFQMGTEEDVPVVGDWNGDGVDDPAVYREITRQTDIRVDR